MMSAVFRQQMMLGKWQRQLIREVVTKAVGVEEAPATPLPAPVMWHQQGADLPGTSLVYVDEEEIIHLQKNRKLELALLEESIMAHERKQEAEQAKYMYYTQKLKNQKQTNKKQ